MKFNKTIVISYCKGAAALAAALIIIAASTQAQPVYRYAGKLLKVTHDQTIKGLDKIFTVKGVPIKGAAVGEETNYIALISNDYRSVYTDSTNTETEQINTTWCEIIDTTGQVLFETHVGVQWMSFNPEGDKLAVITGRRTLETMGPMQLRLGIIDIADSSLTWLMGSDTSYSDSVDYAVYWTRTGDLYINGPNYEIYKVDPKNGKLHDTGWTGLLDMSPDGRYQLVNAADVISGEFIQLFDLKTGENLSPEFYQICGESWDKSDFGSRLAVKWLGSKDRNLLGINLWQRVVVIDVDQRKILFDQPFSDINVATPGWFARPSLPLVVESRQPKILELPEE